MPIPTRCLCCGSCHTSWSPSDELKQHYLPKHADYRDSLPLDFATVQHLYKPYVKEGEWTLGLCEMWFPKSKPVKRSVHVPCWDSFKFNPLKWRGIVAGRTCKECCWTGMHEIRWARSAYAGAAGRKFVLPIKDVTKSEDGFKSNTAALCLLYYVFSIIFGLGITQVFTRLGTCNFAACYSCFSRARLRRAYKLPPTFGCPFYVDDCLVHFACIYCASHQELREMVVRGVDGPGMFIMDTLPHSWDHVEGHADLLAKRRAELDRMLMHPPKYFTLGRKKEEEKTAEDRPAKDTAGPASTSSKPLGWIPYAAPQQQEMGREAAHSNGSAQ